MIPPAALLHPTPRRCSLPILRAKPASLA